MMRSTSSSAMNAIVPEALFRHGFAKHWFKVSIHGDGRTLARRATECRSLLDSSSGGHPNRSWSHDMDSSCRNNRYTHDAKSAAYPVAVSRSSGENTTQQCPSVCQQKASRAQFHANGTRVGSLVAPQLIREISAGESHR